MDEASRSDAMRAHDIIVVGGSTVGLHAALKAAVLCHDVLVVDKGERFARIAQAPCVANVPLAPGISGRELLARQRRALDEYADLSGRRLVTRLDGHEATDARRDGDRFVVTLRAADGALRDVRARVLILATGIVDRKPGIDAFASRGHATLEPFVHRALVGHCILCEGWSLGGRRVAIVGCDEAALEVARDVRDHFGGDVVVLTDGAEAPADASDLLLERAPIRGYAQAGTRLRIELDDAPAVEVDKAIFGMGTYKANNELAARLGAKLTRQGFVETDENGEAIAADGGRIRGLFVVGDLRAGRWKQVVVGWGDAETAVVTAYARRLEGASTARPQAARGART